MIRFENISKTFQDSDGTITILDTVSFEISAGEQIALMGASGSGKSTLLYLAGAMEHPDQGHIYFKGLQTHASYQRIDNLADTEQSAFRQRHLGFVFQQYNLMACLPVFDNLLFQRRLCGLPDKSPWVDTLIEHLELQPLLKRFPEQLSGGQQQRVAIGRALAHQPQLVLADEPTGNLDDRLSQHVMPLFTQLSHDLGSALLLVTHSVEIAQHCQQQWVLRHGKLNPQTK